MTSMKDLAFVRKNIMLKSKTDVSFYLRLYFYYLENILPMNRLQWCNRHLLSLTAQIGMRFVIVIVILIIDIRNRCMMAEIVRPISKRVVYIT